MDCRAWFISCWIQESTWSDVDVVCTWKLCAAPSQNMYVKVDECLVNSWANDGVSAYVYFISFLIRSTCLIRNHRGCYMLWPLPQRLPPTTSRARHNQRQRQTSEAGVRLRDGILGANLVDLHEVQPLKALDHFPMKSKCSFSFSSPEKYCCFFALPIDVSFMLVISWLLSFINYKLWTSNIYRKP